MRYKVNVSDSQSIGIYGQTFVNGDIAVLPTAKENEPGLQKMIKHGILIPQTRSLTHKLLVVGCGHSGTMYMAHLFQALGLDVPHERPVGKDGIVRWSYTHLYKHELQKPVFAAEDHNEEFCLPDDVFVMHMVRHPLKVIASVCNMDDDIWKFVGLRAKHRGVDWNPLDDPHPIRGMKYWMLWNCFAESLADYRFRIESLPIIFLEMLDKLDLQDVDLPEIPLNTNTHKPTVSYTWGDLYKANPRLCGNIYDMSEQYGYESPVIGKYKVLLGWLE